MGKAESKTYKFKNKDYNFKECSNLTQIEIANKIGINHERLSAILKGKVAVRKPTAILITAIFLDHHPEVDILQYFDEIDK